MQEGDKMEVGFFVFTVIVTLLMVYMWLDELYVSVFVHKYFELQKLKLVPIFLTFPAILWLLWLL